MKIIAQQQYLQNLWLSNTGVTDAGLIHLKNLKQLRVLGLARTGVTDVGVKHLGDINSLREVYLYPNKIGDKAVEGLKAKLPGIKIAY